MLRREIAVVGGGLAGTSAALAFARAGFDTVLIAPRSQADPRSTALIGRSVAFLHELGILDMLGASAEPLMVMRLIDDTDSLFRSPPVEFRSSEIGLPAFGYSVLNSELMAALEERVDDHRNLERVEAKVVELEADSDCALIRLDNGMSVKGDLVVAADGRKSVLRDLAKISVRSWSYPQIALVTNFGHALPHRNVSNEFHTTSGPFTQVPMNGNRSSLVWVEEPRLAEFYHALKSDKLDQVVETKLHSILGKVSVDEPMQRFPLAASVVERFTAERLVLIGEAAHAFPPIGAQGLNLGLRDCAILADLLSQSRDDPGRRSTLSRYERARRTDVRSRTIGVDLLNRSLLADFLPVQMARASGLSVLRESSLLRRFVMREGISPGGGLFGVPSAIRERIRRNDVRPE